MIVTKAALSRRAFLRGAGVALSLPFLDAMIPALSGQAAASSVPRIGFVYIPMGMVPGEWTPEQDGPLRRLSPSLSALEPVRDQVSVVTNLQIKNAYPDGGAGGHATANCAFLSAAHARRTEGTDYALSVPEGQYEWTMTVDQLAARRIGRDTLLPSLELSTDLFAPVGNCDNGFSCAYLNNLSWSSPTTPLPAEPHPRVVFERLFGVGGTAEERRIELRKNASILDWVLEDIDRLQASVGPADRMRVDQYLDSVRELERRIERAEEQGMDASLENVERPVGVPPVWEDHVKLMFDLQVLALEADITRVVTFQLARELNRRTYPYLGVPDPHHPLSHHRNDPASLAKLAKINAHHVGLFAYFLERLRATPDGGGTLLDNSVFLLGSGMGNSDVHNHDNIPIVVAGGGGGRMRGGVHVRYAELTPLANLLLTVLDGASVHLEGLADSTGRVSELLA